MSTLDTSRHLNQPTKHYAGARLQQGRILTDADFNEAALLGAEDQRQSLLGFIGAGLESSSASPDDGFSLGLPIAKGTSPPQTDPVRVLTTLTPEIFLVGGVSKYVRPVSIRAGTFYLGGMRLELESPEPFALQRDFLQMPPDDIPIRDQANNPRFWQLYYLEAWEQLITPVEDPEFLEKALGPHGTSVRVRRMRRVRSFSIDGFEPTSCHEMWQEFLNQLQFPGPDGREGTLLPETGEFVPAARLQLFFNPQFGDGSCFDCNPQPGGRFLGAANQTLRIMLTGFDRFVWALDNAAPLYRVSVKGLASGGEISVKLLSPLKDGAHAPLLNRVVEIIPFAALLDGPRPAGPVNPHLNKVADEIGAFSRVVKSYDPNTRSFTIANDAPGVSRMRGFVHEWDDDHPGFDQLFVSEESVAADERFFYMRLWHEAQTNDEIELPAQTDPFEEHRLLGKTGIFAQFQALGGRGASWTVALRPETPEAMVPFEFTKPEGVPPNGPRHFFAPLVYLRGDDNKASVVQDCRPIMRPITDVDCVTFTVGDGHLVKGEFTSIQEAIDTLPDEGGTVLVRPGTYVGRVVIQGRTNVTLLGCGDVTVIQSPPEFADGLVRITGGSSKISVSGFRFRLAGENGVLVQNSSEVTVADLSFELGAYAAGGFVVGLTSPETPLIRAETSQQLAFGGLELNPVNRPGISLSSCAGLSIENVNSNATRDVDPGTLPVLELEACQGGVVRNVSFKTFGQFGIVLKGEDNADIEIERMAAECNSQRFSDSRFAMQHKPAVDVEGGRRIKLRGSRILMVSDEQLSTHAAVVVRGEDIEVSGNHIECGDRASGPRVFGGVQIRGGSSRITLRDNTILRGVGHGVTLGSVVWLPPSGPARREGAGENQMPEQNGSVVLTGGLFSFSDGVTYTVQSEGSLTDIVIADNRIEGFSSNGVSSLTVFGLGPLDQAEFIEISRLRVEGNRIRDCVRFPLLSPDIVQPQIRQSTTDGLFLWHTIAVLPYGGIVLGHVNQADIFGNSVVDNGTSPVVPVNGIFVGSCETLSVCRNVVTNNGGRAGTEAPQRGVKAGIAVLLAGLGNPQNDAGLDEVLLKAGASLLSDGLSVRVSDNMVRHPEGRALQLVGAGPMLVEGNFLSSEGYHGSTDPNSPEELFAVGDVVFIQNLGAPWERFNVNQTDFDAPTNPAVLSVSTRGDFNDYNTPRDALVYLFNSVPRSPRHFMGVGGQVMFQHNQVVYDWDVKRMSQFNEPLTIFAVAIMSLDHTSVSANQFGLRLRTPSTPQPVPDIGSNEPFYAHVFVTGATVEVTSNRVAENADTARFSLLALGELAWTLVNNQTMHQVHATGANPEGFSDVFRFKADNQEMMVKRAQFVVNSDWVFNLGARTFMTLLNRPNNIGPLPTTIPGG